MPLPSQGFTEPSGLGQVSSLAPRSVTAEVTIRCCPRDACAIRDITDCNDLGQERLMAQGFPFQRSPSPEHTLGGGAPQDTTQHPAQQEKRARTETQTRPQGSRCRTLSKAGGLGPQGSAIVRLCQNWKYSTLPAMDNGAATLEHILSMAKLNTQEAGEMA